MKGGGRVKTVEISQVTTTLRLRGLLRQGVEQIFVGRGVHVAGVRVSLHQCVDLQLGVIERVQGGFLHVPVDRLTHPGVEAHLGISNTGRKNEMRTHMISHELFRSQAS